jgi:hypothetical protein
MMDEPENYIPKYNQILDNLDPKKGLKAVSIDNFLSKVNENDIILSYTEIDLKKHPHLKDKLNIVVQDEQTAKNIEKLC